MSVAGFIYQAKIKKLGKTGSSFSFKLFTAKEGAKLMKGENSYVFFCRNALFCDSFLFLLHSAAKEKEQTKPIHPFGP
jgi:hypothetical protein